MAAKTSLSTTFEPERTIQPIYTGGSVALDYSGRLLASCLGEEALITDLNTGKELARIEGVRYSSGADGKRLLTQFISGRRSHINTHTWDISVRLENLY